MTIAEDIQADLPSLILDIEPHLIADLIWNWRRDRELSDVMSKLNSQLLTGTPDERARAKAALSHLGFL